MSRMSLFTPLFALVAVAGVACSSTHTTLPPSDGKLALGNWGGDSAGMIVGDTAMHLHVACTFGDVSGRLELGPNGEIDATGTYVLRAYPITVGPSLPARFTGRVDGTTATITVLVNDTTTHSTVQRGPIKVKLGDDAKLGPCPICRRPILTAGSYGATINDRLEQRITRVATAPRVP